MTEPQFAMAVDYSLFATSWSLDVTVAGFAAFDTITKATGTAYTDGSGTADDFFVLLAAALVSVDNARTGDGAVWTVAWASGTVEGAVEIKRVGTSRAITNFDFSSGQGRLLGASADAYTGTGESEWTGSTSNSPVEGTTMTFTSQHAARYMWRPRETMAGRNEHKPRRTVARARGVTGRVVTDTYASSYHDRPINIDAVKGAVIYQWMADDSGYASTVSGMTAGDPNIALEAFWGDLLTVSSTSGTPPTVRLAPDSGSPGTYTEIWMTDGDFLDEMAAALTEQSPNPTLYGVAIEAQTVVS